MVRRMQNFIRNFIRIGPGRWKCVKASDYQSPGGRIQVCAGSRFFRGTSFMGIDLAKLLDEQYEKDSSRRNGNT